MDVVSPKDLSGQDQRNTVPAFPAAIIDDTELYQITFSTISRKSTREVKMNGVTVTFGIIEITSPSRLFRNCSSLL
jgi:hypothetical protein